MPSLSDTLKSVRELGLRQTLAYLAYQLGKRSGWYRLAGRPKTDAGPYPVASLALGRPDIGTPADDDPSFTQLDRLGKGRVRVFGRVDLPLDFTWENPPGHWTAYDRGLLDGRDIKFAWEPARFCWAADLARLSHSRDPAPLRDLFADQVTAFMRHNPAYQGPHWASAQEAALRLVHLALGHAALGDCLPDFDRIAAVHARRIPLTLSYARAQDNNHLLSEAAGLFTAGVLVPDHPEAAGWRRTGRQTFNRAVLRQFAPDGAYMQQSTNYHRLALTLALWMAHLYSLAGEDFPEAVRVRLGAAVRWLHDRCDPATGAVPNLGANDGAHILPLSPQPYADFRPVVQAAARAFLGGPVYDPGPWDELGGWLGLENGLLQRAAPAEPAGERRRGEQESPEPGRRADALQAKKHPSGSQLVDSPPDVQPSSAEGEFSRSVDTIRPALVHPDLPSQAYLRAVEYHNRPGHADQLHLDLWWAGANIARDPGTYRYNAGAPWENALQTAHHHNTLTIDGLDQMTRAGRFLYVDRATGHILENRPTRQVAEHDGYRRLGLVHRRTVEAAPEGWRVRDEIVGRPGRHRVRLHWLLPDWDWSFEDGVLQLASPHGPLVLETHLPPDAAPVFSLVRAGEALLGPPAAATLGWFSPTYAVKEPALSFGVAADVEVAVEIESVWLLGDLVTW